MSIFVGLERQFIRKANTEFGSLFPFSSLICFAVFKFSSDLSLQLCKAARVLKGVGEEVCHVAASLMSSIWLLFHEWNFRNGGVGKLKSVGID